MDPQAGTDLNGDGFTTDRPGALARNSFRLPTSKTVDLSLAKTLAVGGPHQLELRMDVFNLFDAFNVTRVNNTYGRVVGSPVATFMQPTRVSQPAAVAVRGAVSVLRSDDDVRDQRGAQDGQPGQDGSLERRQGGSR